MSAGKEDKMERSYYSAMGGHPPQTDLLTGRAVFTEAYAVIPRGVMRDIVTSCLPHWNKTRLWIIARPLSGFVMVLSFTGAPLWSFTHKDIQALDLARALAIGRYGEGYAGGIGVNSYPAFAHIGG